LPRVRNHERMISFLNTSWSKMALLILNRDGVDLGTHELVLDVVMIGRAPLNHIVIDDPTVSAHHARLLRAADSYWLPDLHSKNGIKRKNVCFTDAEWQE